MKRHGRSAGKGPRAVQLALHVMRTSGLSPKGVIQSLRPAELTYLCEVCAMLEELGICDDVFDEGTYEPEDY